MVGTDYGDISHTVQALEIRIAGVYGIEKNAYSESGFAVITDQDEDEPDSEQHAFCLIAGRAAHGLI